jgi:hypothetical protein
MTIGLVGTTGFGLISRLDVDPTVDVEALKAHDDFGNEYIIVADERNPLIVSFTFNAVSTGVIGIDVGV